MLNYQGLQLILDRKSRTP